MTVGQLEGLIAPATPVAVVLILGFCALGYLVTRRLGRAIGRVGSTAAGIEERLAASIGRIGARTGQLEQDRALDHVRRYQLEATLRAHGIGLPPWPDDVDDDDRYPSYPPQLDDQVDDDAPTSASPSVPPLPAFPRHRR